METLLKRILSCLLACLPGMLLAQPDFSGRVTDEKHEPVKYASVHLLNTKVTVVANEAGMFSIKDIPAGMYTLHVSAAGFAAQQAVIDLRSMQETEIVMRRSAKYLDEVFVTAQKKEEMPGDVPFSVSVLSSAEARQYRLWNSKELTGIVPNLFAANPGDNRNVISIRGITSSSYDPAVTTYIDGVSQFSLDTYIAELLDIERIEVLRGPQGTLYGRNSMAGVINIITKQPGLTANGFAEVSTGSYGLQRYSAGVRFPLSKKLFAGIAAMLNSTNGYYVNEFNGSHFDKQHSINGNFYLKYLPGEKWAVTLNAKQQATRNRGAFPLVYDVQQAFENPFRLSQNAVAEMTDNVFNSSLSVAFTGIKFNFTSQTAWQYNYRFYDQPIDADFSPLDAVSIFNDYGRNWNNSKAFTQEIRFVSSPLVSKWKWTAGAYLFVQKNPVKQATKFGNDAKLIGAPDSLFSIINTASAKNNGYSFYGQSSYALSKRLEVIVGLRYDHEQRKLSVLSEYQKDQSLFAIVPDTAAAVKFHAVSPKAGLLWHATNNVNMFLNYSRGYRAGGLTQISIDPGQAPLYPYKPEYSNNIELGIKSEINQRWHANATVFYTRATDVQVPTLILPDAITVTRNTGLLTSKGIEAELRAAVIKGLQLVYNFGYTDAVYKNLQLPQQGQQKNFSGNKQVFTPEFTSMLAAQYELAISSTIKFIARGEWFYFGEEYFDLANFIRQSPYHLLNVRAGVSFKKLELMFWSRNLTDTRYVDYAYDFGGVHLGAPRVYGVSGHVRF
jgi:iron complex outermembrane recepter protein